MTTYARLSELTPAATAEGADLLEITRPGSPALTRSVTVDQVRAGLMPATTDDWIATAPSGTLVQEVVSNMLTSAWSTTAGELTDISVGLNASLSVTDASNWVEFLFFPGWELSILNTGNHGSEKDESMYCSIKWEDNSGYELANVAALRVRGRTRSGGDMWLGGCGPFGTRTKLQNTFERNIELKVRYNIIGSPGAGTGEVKITPSGMSAFFVIREYKA